MSGKVFISAVSLILVMGVAVGTIVVVDKKHHDPGQISAHQNAVEQMCKNSDDQKLCQHTLSKVDGTFDPKAFLAAVVEATTNSVIEALNMSDRLIVDHDNSDKGIKMALNDCKDLLQFAMDSLQESADLLRNNDIKTVSDQSPDFRNWLAAVISHQQSCMDGFDDKNDGEKQVKSQLQEQGLDDMAKLAGIALDIVADLARILMQFGLKLDVNPASRRPLQVDSEGYPKWFSASDRKLLRKMQRGHHIKPNVVVAQDGSGQFKTIMEAIALYPSKGVQGRYVIFVKAGTYAEYITIPKAAVNILMYGEGAGKTIVTGNKNSIDDRLKTMQTATFANTANGFIAKYMSFVNSAGAEKHQVVALRNQGDMSAFFDCAIVGYQDTMFVQSNRQFYRNCSISGTIDFIFGMSNTLIQSSRIILRKPLDNQFNTVTADGTSRKNMDTGIVIQNCDIVSEPALFPVRFALKSYLGRPWKAYSKTVVMESRIGDFIQPEGWAPWDGDLHLSTLYYAEYNNMGPGADVQGRVKWPGYKGLISENEAIQFTAGQFLSNGISRAKDWMKTIHVPFDLGFTKPRFK